MATCNSTLVVITYLLPQISNNLLDCFRAFEPKVVTLHFSFVAAGLPERQRSKTG